MGILEFFVFPNNKNVFSLKNELLKSEKSVTKTLILGSSHTLFGINPKFLTSKSINAANKSRKLETDYLILKNNRKKLKTIKTIIIPISFYTLFTNKLTPKERRLYYHFYDLKEYNQGWLKNRLLLNEPYKGLINDAFFNNINKRMSKLGWRANKDNYVFDKHIIKERIGNIDSKIYNTEVIDYNLTILQKIIDLTETYKIQLLILLPPYHPDFYRYSGIKYTQKIHELFQQINFKSAKIINSDKFKINDSMYFENVDHLNTKGSVLFTKKIDSILKN